MEQNSSMLAPQETHHLFSQHNVGPLASYLTETGHDDGERVSLPIDTLPSAMAGQTDQDSSWTTHLNRGHPSLLFKQPPAYGSGIMAPKTPR